MKIRRMRKLDLLVMLGAAAVCCVGLGMGNETATLPAPAAVPQENAAASQGVHRQ